MRAISQIKSIFILLTSAYISAASPVNACVGSQLTPYLVDGVVTWGNPPRPQPPGTTPRVVREDVVPPKGRIEFGWTRGITDRGAILPNDCYDIFKFDNTSDKPLKVQMVLPILRPDDPPITDWFQTIEGKNTRGVITSSTVHAGNIQRRSRWQFHPLDELPNISWRIPDLAAFQATSPLKIYTAVNLDIYLKDNSNGFLDGNWSIGKTLDDLGLSIINGQITGLNGIYWSLTDFFVDVNSDTGWTPIGGSSNFLNSNDFQSTFGAIGILGSHSADVPEPTTLALVAVCFCGIFIQRFSRRAHRPNGVRQTVLD